MIKIRNKKNKSRMGMSDSLYNTIVTIFCTIILFIVLYPMVYVVSSSFSSGSAVTAGRVILWPVDFSFVGYELVFKNQMIWTGFKNTFLYVGVGTILTLIFTIFMAYPLSRKDYQAKPMIIKICTFFMFFGGGLIPSYILNSQLGLVNTRIHQIISGCFAISFIIMMRVFFQSNVPYELLESAKMDGITDFGHLMRIVLPLSRAILAVITLYEIVARWNAYFGPMLYLRDRDKYPLQLVVNEILNRTSFDTSTIQDQNLLEQMANAIDSMRYSLIVVSTVPMLILYPFVQKFFDKGVTLGSIKG